MLFPLSLLSILPTPMAVESGFEVVVVGDGIGDGMDDESVEAYSDYEYDYDDDDGHTAEHAPRSCRPETEAEALTRAILESAREAGALINEDADWDEAVGDDALATRLGREHDEHVAHNLASLSKDKGAPSSRVQTDLETAMVLQDEEDRWVETGARRPAMRSERTAEHLAVATAQRSAATDERAEMRHAPARNCVCLRVSVRDMCACGASCEGSELAGGSAPRPPPQPRATSTTMKWQVATRWQAEQGDYVKMQDSRGDLGGS